MEKFNKKIKSKFSPKLVDSGINIDDSVSLGSEICGKNLSWLQENGITHVANLASNSFPFDSQICYFRNSVLPDSRQFVLSTADKEKINRIISKLEVLRAKGKKILVHCKRGLSRSTFLVTLYLMKVRKMTLKQSVEHLKSLKVEFSKMSEIFKSYLEDLDLLDNHENSFFFFQQNKDQET